MRKFDFQQSGIMFGLPEVERVMVIGVGVPRITVSRVTIACTNLGMVSSSK